MRSNCYWKLKKQIEELNKKMSQGGVIGNQDLSSLTNTVNQLQQAIADNASQDSEISNKVDQLQQDLEDNSNKDQQLSDRVDAIESGGGENSVIDDDDINDLFGG